MITITSNAGQVAAALERATRQVESEANRRLSATANAIMTEMRVYPPERPGQKYKRTGTLGRGWRSTKGKMAVTMTANTTRKRYAKWVIGNAKGESQAWMHTGRWKLFREVTDKHMEKAGQKLAAWLLKTYTAALKG